jgi:transposase
MELEMAKSKAQLSFAVTNPHAGGIDVGSRSHWVSVGLGEGQTREFGVFTVDLHELCQWVQRHGVKTVAMESTGFYWKQLFVMLQTYGIEVYLVNASHTKNIRGRKTSDLSDSQWIWKLHSTGFLSASFQPDVFTEELRTYTRHRKVLIEGASRYVNKMQKCLTLMNIQLPVVLSDITGLSGMAIIKAILSGERDAKKLAALAHDRVKTDKETIEKALTGFWRADYLFELKQNWQMYNHFQDQLAECDKAIDDLLESRVVQTNQIELVYEPVKKNVDKRMLPHLTSRPTPFS